MFRKLAQFLQTVTTGELTPADRVFTFHPEQLSRWLDEIWAQGGISKWDGVLKLDRQLPLDDMINMTKLPGGLLSNLASGLNKPAGGNLSYELPFGHNPPAVGTGLVEPF